MPADYQTGRIYYAYIVAILLGLLCGLGSGFFLLLQPKRKIATTGKKINKMQWLYHISYLTLYLYLNYSVLNLYTYKDTSRL